MFAPPPRYRPVSVTEAASGRNTADRWVWAEPWLSGSGGARAGACDERKGTWGGQAPRSCPLVLSEAAAC